MKNIINSIVRFYERVVKFFKSAFTMKDYRTEVPPVPTKVEVDTEKEEAAIENKIEKAKVVNKRNGQKRRNYKKTSKKV